MKNNLFTGLFLPLGALFIAAAVSLFCGQHNINWQNYADDPILELRLIRIAAACTVGASLALAGLLLQAVLRNVLAEPFTLGISGGASVGAAAAFVLNWHIISCWAVPAMALAGALLLLIVVLWIAAGKNSEGLLLSGVIAGTTASSILMYMVSIADRDELAGVTWWMLGDLQSADERLLCGASLTVVAAAIIVKLFARELNAVALGGEIAWNMGVNEKFFARFFIVIASLLAAQTVALAGLIAFVGLIVPHLIRRFYPGDHRYLIFPAALWGGCFLILCDWLARVIHPTYELPVGVLTAAVGGGLFIYVLNCRKEKLL